MKKSLLLLLAIFVLCGCSQLNRAKNVAEKGLKELGNGKYAGEYFGGTYINMNILHLFDSPYFARYGMNDSEAEDFMKTGFVRTERIEAEHFFETDRLFKEIVFVDSYMYTRDFYNTDFFTPRIKRYTEEGRLDEEREWQEKMISYHKDAPGFFQVGLDYCYIQYKDVPFYQLKYKLDNKYMATVYVACVKGEKPKITSVFIQ